MDPDDWRAPIAKLTGGDTLEAMLWFRSPGVYRARVYRADVPRTAEREHPTDPAAALARALLAAAAPDDWP